MISKIIQSKIDSFMSSDFFLKYIPYSVKPNYFTFFRFLIVPFLYILLFRGQIFYALLLFLLAAFTDLIDGVLARTRKQVTDLGKIIDPIADKMIISVVLIYAGTRYFIVKVFLLIMLLELIANLFGPYFTRTFGIPIGANRYGKIKMVLQCFFVIMLLLGMLLKIQSAILIAEICIYAALLFAILSGIEQVHKSYANHKDKKKNLLR